MQRHSLKIELYKNKYKHRWLFLQNFSWDESVKVVKSSS